MAVKEFQRDKDSKRRGVKMDEKTLWATIEEKEVRHPLPVSSVDHLKESIHIHIYI